MRQAPVGMVEVRTTPYQGQATGWPQSQPARRARKRRDSKVIYHNNNSRCSPPRYIPVTSKAAVFSNPAYAFDQMSLRPTEEMSSRQEMQQQCYDRNSMGYRNMQAGIDGSYELNRVSQQVNQAGPPLQPSLASYTLASGPPASPPFYTCHNLPPGQDGFYLHVANEVGEGWSDVGLSNNVNPEQSGISALDIPFGSFGNIDSLPGSTPTSPDSDGYIYPLMTTGIEPSQELNPVSNLDLSGKCIFFGGDTSIFFRRMWRCVYFQSTTLTFVCRCIFSNWAVNLSSIVWSTRSEFSVSRRNIPWK